MGVLAAKWVLEALQTREQERDGAPRLHMATPELVMRMSAAKPKTMDKPGRGDKSRA
jgi:hypothetical protein